MFQLEGCDEVWSLPLMGSLPVKTVREMTKMSKLKDDVEATNAAIDLFDGLCPGLTDIVTIDQLAEVMRAWGDASGISMGESKASAD